MGFFSKVWKGVKKTFKKIGKGIKKGFQKFGKFMGKIGWLGQIAMSMILPGIGSLFANGLGSMLGLSKITSLSQLAGNLAGSTNMFAKALGHTMGVGIQAVNLVKAPFESITKVITNFGKSAMNGMSRFFGGGNVFDGHTFTSGMSKDWTKIKQGITGAEWRGVKATKVDINTAIANGTMPRVKNSAGEIIEMKDGNKITAAYDPNTGKGGYVDPIKKDKFKVVDQYKVDDEWTSVKPDDIGSVEYDTRTVKTKSEYKFTPHKLEYDKAVPFQSGKANISFEGTDPLYSEPELFDIADESGDFFRSTEDKGFFKSLLSPSRIMDKAQTAVVGQTVNLGFQRAMGQDQPEYEQAWTGRNMYSPNPLVAQQTAMSLNPQSQVQNYALEIRKLLDTSPGYPLNPVEHVLNPGLYEQNLARRLTP
tara:strand:- start:10136 stop:11398 length:1263 start_codon:yes stop_codon:yes gene_type:complete